VHLIGFYYMSLYLATSQIIKYSMRRKKTVHKQLMSNSYSPGKMSHGCMCCCYFAVAVWIFTKIHLVSHVQCAACHVTKLV